MCLAVYPWISASSSILPFLLQGTGSILSVKATLKGLEPAQGTRLMTAGLVLQILAQSFYGILCLEFVIRAHLTYSLIDPSTKIVRSTKRFTLFCIALVYVYIFTTIRCTYRIIELSAGWNSKLIRCEFEFIVLEGL